MKRTITCINEDGVKITFGKDFAPFVLEKCDGIYSVHNNVIAQENTMMDGATYQGSITRMRNIVLNLIDKSESDHRINRELLYTLFKVKSCGTLIYEEGDGSESRSIQFYVESIEVESIGKARRAMVSLLCPDPFFVGPEDVKVILAGWESLFEFPHEFVQEGEELGSRGRETLKNIVNKSAADNIGMTIRICATGPVTNPTIHHVEQQESITVGNDRNPLHLSYGEEVIIHTGTNDKHVYLIRNGEKTEINEFLTEESEFLQLMRGNNTLGYSAQAGEHYMTVDVSYRYKYLGV